MRRAATTPLLLVLALGSTGVAAQSPADNAATPAYVDRVIDNLPPEPQDEGAALAYDTSGWPLFAAGNAAGHRSL